MVAVPADKPVTDPDVPTVATVEAPELQTPPGELSLSKDAEETHTASAPEIDPEPGSGSTVTTAVAKAVPQALETE